MKESRWKEFDLKVASDYTTGSPEYYRTLLRRQLGLPTLLPGETSGDTQKRDNENSPTKPSS